MSMPRALLLILLAAAMALGCGKDEPKLAPDPEFSINVLETPSWWPREEKDWPGNPIEARLMEDTLAERGRPDFLRVVWTRDRRIVRQSDMISALSADGRGLKDATEFEWVYLDDEEVVRFKAAETEVRPLDGRLRAVCLYGDPQAFKSGKDPLGRERETYFYYDRGKIFYFLADDGTQVGEDTIPVTPYYPRRE
ncbi:MAG: hypothetical protein SF028_10375 [Candidatus Sumerlaeia bacterium]|nr:hypothetical protein [Candidatus Sumerlaeia bacterium]